MVETERVGFKKVGCMVWLKGGAILCYFLLFWGRQPHHCILFCFLFTIGDV